jgi:predicted HicB family RNase H-like nuclease
MIKSYKGYSATVAIDEDQGVLFGEVLGINDVVTFQAANVGDLVKEFHDSVDDYLDFCRQRGEAPNKPYSGRIVLRMDPEIHRKLAIRSKQMNESINDLIVSAVIGVLE